MEELGGIMGSPLVKGIPTALVIGLIVWILTEALTSGWMPEKYRPAFAVFLGVLLGYAVHRANMVDFGGGPDGWLNALVIGAFGGALAPISHGLLKNIPPFSLLAKATPSGQKAEGVKP